MTADPHLVIALAINAVYTIEGSLWYSAPATADIDVRFAVPTGATGTYTARGVGLAQSASSTDGYTLRTEKNTITQTRGLGAIESAGVPQSIHGSIYGTVHTSGTAGNLTLEWAQRVADIDGTVLQADSWLKVTRVA